ncbi:MAG: hypothetical protein JSU67_00155 [Gammaproteobacteria bacterium]|nr:MAG: hypothetical protein JSU67_00155 [Gammaproteobacteria bacterium]
MKGFNFVIVFSILILTPNIEAAGSEVPQDIMAKIKARAASELPNNQAEQKKRVEAQTRAYKEVQDYQNKKLPGDVLLTIRNNVVRSYPYDFTTQLFFLNHQANTYLKLGILSSRLLPPQIVECEDLKWKLKVKGRPAVYRGSVKPGTVDVIHIEVRGSRGLIGQNFGFPNPGGSWEVMIWGDSAIFNKHKETFYCEKY